MSQLLVNWLKYILNPSSNNKIDFDSTLNYLQSQGKLFPIISFGLQESRYSTIVIFLDEVSSTTMSAIKSIWDNVDKENGTNIASDTNIVFVLAIKEGTINTIRSDLALNRRFYDFQKEIILDGPKNPNTSSEDLIEIFSCIDRIVKGEEYLYKPNVDREQTIQRIKAKYLFATPTWHDLWRDSIEELIDL